MEITFQLLQQHNPWWFREEIILDDEKIVDCEGQTCVPPVSIHPLRESDDF